MMLSSFIMMMTISSVIMIMISSFIIMMVISSAIMMISSFIMIMMISSFVQYNPLTGHYLRPRVREGNKYNGTSIHEFNSFLKAVRDPKSS